MVNNLPLLLQSSLFLGLLTAVSIWDIRKRIIPDTLCFCIALAGFLAFEPKKLFGFLVALVLLIAALIWGGMGGGDIKLVAAAGLVLGFYKSMVALIVGLTLLLVFHTVINIIQRLRGRTVPSAYPLAPFLSTGCLAAYFLL